MYDRKEVRDSIKEIRWTAWQGLTGLVFPGILVAGLMSGGLYVVGIGTGLIGHVANPDNIVVNYEWFIQQYSDIHAMDNQIKLATQAEVNFKEATGPRDKWGYREQEQSIQLANALTGLKQQRESMIALYNSRARMMTRSGFKSRDLPDHIGE